MPIFPVSTVPRWKASLPTRFFAAVDAPWIELLPTFGLDLWYISR